MSGPGYMKRERQMDSGYDMPPQKRMMSGRGGGGYHDGMGGRPQYQGGDGYMGGPGHVQPLMRGGGQTQNMPSLSEHPSFVLCITVYNPKYPITVDVINTICSADNRIVNRIMIFRQNGVQVMVEFDSVETASNAREALNGADIYSGCCTLKIDFAKPIRLGVMRNDADSWDYTNPHLGKEPVQKSMPLLPDPKQDGNGMHYGGGPGGYLDEPPMGGRGGRGGPGGYDGGYNGGYEDDYDGYGGGYNRRGGGPPHQGDGGRYPPQGHRQDPYSDPYGPAEPQYSEGRGRGRGMGRGMGRGGGDSMMRGGGRGGRGMDRFDEGGEMGGQGGMLQQGCVLMVYGCGGGGKVNCQRLFNLFCLYGNVVRIRFLTSKEGSAMVQMGDAQSCERVMKCLSGCHLFDSKLSIGYSKQAFIQDVIKPITLPDGSPAFTDFMGTRNNRFSTAEAAAKNRVMAPSNCLYFFNVPADIKEDDVKSLFVEAEAVPPVRVRIFPSKNEKSCTGIAEWDDKSECVEALMLTNHATIPNPNGKNPFIVKLAFTGPAKN